MSKRITVARSAKPTCFMIVGARTGQGKWHWNLKRVNNRRGTIEERGGSATYNGLDESRMAGCEVGACRQQPSRGEIWAEIDWRQRALGEI